MAFELPPRARATRAPCCELAREDRRAAVEALRATSPQDQVALVCNAPLAARGELLDLLPEPERVIPLLPEAELCFTVKAIGLADAAWMLELATPEQVTAGRRPRRLAAASSPTCPRSPSGSARWPRPTRSAFRRADRGARPGAAGAATCARASRCSRSPTGDDELVSRPAGADAGGPVLLHARERRRRPRRRRRAAAHALRRGLLDLLPPDAGRDLGARQRHGGVGAALAHRPPRGSRLPALGRGDAHLPLPPPRGSRAHPGGRAAARGQRRGSCRSGSRACPALGGRRAPHLRRDRAARRGGAARLPSTRSSASRTRSRSPTRMPLSDATSTPRAIEKAARAGSAQGLAHVAGENGLDDTEVLRRVEPRAPVQRRRESRSGARAALSVWRALVAAPARAAAAALPPRCEREWVALVGRHAARDTHRAARGAEPRAARAGAQRRASRMRRAGRWRCSPRCSPSRGSRWCSRSAAACATPRAISSRSCTRPPTAPTRSPGSRSSRGSRRRSRWSASATAGYAALAALVALRRCAVERTGGRLRGARSLRVAARRRRAAARGRVRAGLRARRRRARGARRASISRARSAHRPLREADRVGVAPPRLAARVARAPAARRVLGGAPSRRCRSVRRARCCWRAGATRRWPRCSPTTRRSPLRARRRASAAWRSRSRPAGAREPPSRVAALARGAARARRASCCRSRAARRAPRARLRRGRARWRELGELAAGAASPRRALPAQRRRPRRARRRRPARRRAAGRRRAARRASSTTRPTRRPRDDARAGARRRALLRERSRSGAARAARVACARSCYVASDAPATDFCARLVAVDAAGRADRSATASRALARDRHAADAARRVDVDCGIACWQLAAGSRLRLEIASASHPRFDRAPNTGEEPARAERGCGRRRRARRCCHDAAHAVVSCVARRCARRLEKSGPAGSAGGPVSMSMRRRA